MYAYEFTCVSCLLVLAGLPVGATTIGMLATYAGQDFANIYLCICVNRCRNK